MKLIKEHTEQVETLIESVGGSKKYYIEGNFMTHSVGNANGRMYEEKILRPAVTKYIDKYIKENRALGELGHPPTPSINLDKVSHIIERLEFKEGTNHVVGRAKVIDTPMGLIAQKLMENGIKLGVSTRGLGTVKQSNGLSYVQPDFVLNTVDIVYDPSGPGCFVEGIMENAEWVLQTSGDWVQVAVDLNKKKINEEVAMEQFTKMMRAFINK